jgi:hypothetical protein
MAYPITIKTMESVDPEHRRLIRRAISWQIQITEIYLDRAGACPDLCFSDTAFEPNLEIFSKLFSKLFYKIVDILFFPS